MGVMWFGDELPPWSGNTSLILGVLEHGRAMVGDRPYLMRMLESFEMGYNVADVGHLASAELAEFRRIAVGWADALPAAEWVPSVTRELFDLIDALAKQIRHPLPDRRG